MKTEIFLYLFPFLEDKIMQVLMAIAALLCSILAYLVYSNWQDFKGNTSFWDQNPETGLVLDGLVVMIIVTLALLSWRYFKTSYDEFEAKKSELMGFWSVSILLGGAYLYSVLEYRFDLPPQPGWVWTMVITFIVFICWVFFNRKYKT